MPQKGEDEKMTKPRREPTYKRYITGPLKRFDERNTGYSRADRDEITGPRHGLEQGLKRNLGKNNPGFTHEDYALTCAGRATDTLVRKKVYSRTDFDRRWNIPEDKKMTDIDTVKMAEKVKKVGKWFGASLVGICELNHLWLYTHWGDHNAKLAETHEVGDPVEVPEAYKYVVVMAFAMDYYDVQRSPAVCPAIDLGYSQMAFTAFHVAEFIRNLGYHAIPSGNDMGLTIPMAVDAGLGELGRNGLLLTEKYGPRVRLSKVFTDLPLKPDEPIDLGAQHFCETCGKCADHCPGNALLKGDRTDQPIDVSTNPGLLKWPVNVEGCLSWWYKSGTTGCTNCIRSCSYNKPAGFMHAIVRGIIKRTSLFDGPLLKADDIMGYGKQVLHESPSEKSVGKNR
jgi:epoxyqueuosine reductase